MRIRNLSITFATLALTACGDSNPDERYDTVARMVGSTVATSDGGGTLGSLRDSLSLAFGGMPAGFTYENGMTFGDHGSVRHEYMMVACRDSEGRLLPECGSQTSTATLIATWSGEVQQPGLEIVSNRQGMWTLSGLQNWMKTRTWMPTASGSSQIECTGVFADGETISLIASETEAMLATSQIMGGTIHLDVEITSTTEGSAIAADVAFDATGTATLVLDDVHRYRIDLTSGLVEKSEAR